MRRALAVVALAALVVVIFWWRHRAPPPAPLEPAAVAADDNYDPHWAIKPPRGVARLEAHRKPNTEHYGLSMLSDPNLPVMAADSLLQSRCPRASFPRTKHALDQLQPNRRFDSRGPVTHADLTVEPDMQVLFTGDKFRLVGDDPLLMTLELFDRDQPVPVTVLSATARALASDGSVPGLEIPVSFSPRDDLVQMATLRLSGTPIEKHAGLVHVDVKYDPGNGNPALATLDLQYQPGGPAPARFTGKFREALKDGSLDLYAGVEVSEPGQYFIMANLFDASGAPTVSMVASNVQLDASTTEVKLEAFGRVIREAEAPSPFTLTNLRGFLFYPGQDPDRKSMPDYTDDYRTQKYPLDAFSDEEYWDAQKQTQIDNILAAARAGTHSQAGISISTAMSQGWQPPW